MTFAEPLLLAGLLLVPLALGAYILVQRRRSRYVVRFTNVDLLTNLVPRTPGWRRHVPTALYLGAMTFLVVALARPSMTLQVPREDALPDVGELNLIDAETGRTVRVDTSSSALRIRFAEAAARDRDHVARELRRLRARHVVLSTSGSWLRSLADQLRIQGLLP